MFLCCLFASSSFTLRKSSFLSDDRLNSGCIVFIDFLLIAMPPIPKTVFIKHCRIEIIAFLFVLFHRDRFFSILLPSYLLIVRLHNCVMRFAYAVCAAGILSFYLLVHGAFRPCYRNHLPLHHASLPQNPSVQTSIPLEIIFDLPFGFPINNIISLSILGQPL